jgi:hypothetical protein
VGLLPGQRDQGGGREGLAGGLAGGGEGPPRRVESRVKRYEEEQKEIEKSARELEKERDEKSRETDELLHRHHGFANSVALFQVSIALGAVAAVTRIKPVWFGSMLVGLVGVFFFGRVL